MPMTPHQKRKEKYKPIFLVDVDIKIPNKTLGIHIQQPIRLYTTTKWDLSQKCKTSLTYKTQVNISYKKNKEQRSLNYLNRCKKVILQNLTHFHLKILSKWEVEVPFFIFTIKIHRQHHVPFSEN